MKKWIAPFLLGILCISCGGGTPTPKHTPTHEVERIALNFIRDVKNNIYAKDIYFFVADTEFTSEERDYFFHRLEKFAKNNTWDLYFTVVDIYEGDEVTADVILKAKSGDIVVFCLDYWNDTQRWELDAYEFPGLTFNRPMDQSYVNYINEIIVNAKDIGVEYSKRETIGHEGTYYIEYK